MAMTDPAMGAASSGASGSAAFRVAAAVVFAAIAALYLLTVAADWTMVGDSTDYVSLAENLLAHGEYRSHFGTYDCTTPPGFALLLSGLIGVLGHRWVALNVVFAGMAVLVIVGFYGQVRRSFGGPAALCVAVVLAVCLPFYWISRQILTDMPFVLTVVGFAWAFRRWQAGGHRGWLVAAVAIATAGTAFRSVGAVTAIVLGFLATWEFVRRRGPGTAAWSRVLGGATGRAALLAFIALLPIILFAVRNRSVPHEADNELPFAMFFGAPPDEGFRPYSSVGEFLAARAARARLYLRSMMADATNVDAFRSAPWPAVMAASLILLGPGSVILLVRRRDPLAWFTALYMPVVAAFPSYGSWHTIWRYCVPALPGAILILWQSLDWYAGRLFALAGDGRPAGTARAWAACLLLVAVNLAAGYGEVFAEVRPYLDRGSVVYAVPNGARQVAAWLQERSAPGDAIVTQTPVFAILTGRPVVEYPREPNAESLMGAARSRSARWIVSSRVHPMYKTLSSALAVRPDLFALRMSNAGWDVYEVAGNGADRPTTATATAPAP